MANIDYTSRDYASLREDLITVVKERIPTWSATDPADVGLAIVEAFAYLGDITSYYTDRVLNEAYLTTATQRQSILDIARMLGYSPSTAMPAVIGSLRVTNTASSPVTIYTGTQFVCNVLDGGVSRTVTFEVQAGNGLSVWSAVDSVVVPPNGSVTVRAVQGNTAYQKLLGVSDGSADQQFEIPTASLLESSLSVASGVIAGYSGASQNVDPQYGYTRYGETLWDAGPFIYTRRVGLGSSTPTTRDFTLILDADAAYIRFGDGVNGSIPPKDHKIYATYRTGGGSFGNVPSGTRFVGPSGLYAVALSDGFGGTNYEPNDSIRRNASAAFRTGNRAVTKRDFADLARTFPGVFKAQARANNSTQVAVYVQPQAPSGYPAPGNYAAKVVRRERASDGTATLVLNSIPANVESGTLSVSGVGTGYDVTDVAFTLVPLNTAYPDASGAPRPTVSYATGTLSAESATPSTGVVTTGEDKEFTALRRGVEAFLEERSAAGTNVVVSGPEYTDLKITATIYVEPTVTQSTAIRAAKQALFGLFDYQNAEMGVVVRAASLAVELAKLPEIGYAVINNLSTSTGSNSDAIPTGMGILPRLLSGVSPDVSPYSGPGAGAAIDTYTEGNLTIKIGDATGIADLGTA